MENKWERIRGKEVPFKKERLVPFRISRPEDLTIYDIQYNNINEHELYSLLYKGYRYITWNGNLPESIYEEHHPSNWIWIRKKIIKTFRNLPTRKITYADAKRY